MTMPYAELSEVEKESDREQVRIALEVIRAGLRDLTSAAGSCCKAN
jgi:hypothetical protein